MFWKKRIYADAAAATPLSRPARRELERLLTLYGNPGALHTEALEAKKELDRARKIIAESIGAHEEEIYFTASGTEGNNWAIHGVLRPLLEQHKELHALVSSVEHQSALEPLRALRREGLSVQELPVNPEGLIFPNSVSNAVTPRTVFVSVQLVNSEMGAIEPVREIAKEIRRVRSARKEGDAMPLYFHCDASQAPLWVDIKVEKLGIDLLVLDGQKVLGPKGVGALYIKRGTPIEPILWGGKQEKNLRGGTENVPQAASFALAMDDAQKGVVRRAKKVTAIRDYLFSEIKKAIPDVMLHGPAGESRVANNLNISIPGLDGEMAVVALDSMGVAISTRSACNTGDENPSHVIRALGVDKALAKTAIRITFLPDISYRQARRIAAALLEAAQRYRRS